MKNLLVLDDRKEFQNILCDWIETKIPENEPWNISHCSYVEEECLSKIRNSDVILFSTSSNNKKHFDFFNKVYNEGHLDNKRVFLISDENLPETPKDPKVEIYKCYEKDFVTDCIDQIVGAQNI